MIEDSSIPKGVITHNPDADPIEARLTRLSTAPRVTKRDVTNAIVSAQYYHFPGTTHTICLLVLRNGHTVVGDSACVNPENFNEGIGREIAYEKALDEVWKALGYELRVHMGGPCKIYPVQPPDFDPAGGYAGRS